MDRDVDASIVSRLFPDRKGQNVRAQLNRKKVEMKCLGYWACSTRGQASSVMQVTPDPVHHP